MPYNDAFTTIGAEAFAGSTLETVICYAPIATLPDGAFRNCTALREVVFVNGVGHIAAGAFEGCTQLQTVYAGPYLASENASFLTDPAQLPDIEALLQKIQRRAAARRSA